MEDTPLGAIISIRSEDDRETLKTFSQEKRKIRDEWRLRIAKKQADLMTAEDRKKTVTSLKSMFMQLAEYKPK